MSKQSTTFKKKPGLGQYNSPREQWYQEYRFARIQKRKNIEPNPKDRGTKWKAQLIIWYERDILDPLHFSPAVNLEMIRMIDDLKAF